MDVGRVVDFYRPKKLDYVIVVASLMPPWRTRRRMIKAPAVTSVGAPTVFRRQSLPEIFTAPVLL